MSILKRLIPFLLPALLLASAAACVRAVCLYHGREPVVDKIDLTEGWYAHPLDDEE